MLFTVPAMAQVTVLSTTANAPLVANAMTVSSTGFNDSGATLNFIAIVDYSLVGPGTLTDNKGNTVTLDTSFTDAASGGRMRVYRVANPTFGTSVSPHIYTYTTVGTSYPSIYTVSAKGQYAPVRDRRSVKNNGSAVTTGDAGSITPSVNNELVIGVMMPTTGTNVTTPVGYTLVGRFSYPSIGNFGSLACYQVQTTATATNPSYSWTGASAYGAYIISFNFDNPPVGVVSGNFSIYYSQMQ